MKNPILMLTSYVELVILKEHLPYLGPYQSQDLRLVAHHFIIPILTWMSMANQ